MGSIDQNDCGVKAGVLCCDWVKGRREHHDLWLARLQDLTPKATVEFHHELRQEARLPMVGPDRNFFVDIEAIAQAHRRELSPCALKFASSLTVIAKVIGAPRSGSMVLSQRGPEL